MTPLGGAMPVQPTGFGTQLRPAVRMRTIAGGVMLGTALLASTALLGGGGTQLPEQPAPGRDDRGNLLTAVQPELQQALLTDGDLTSPEPTHPSPGPGPRADPAQPTAPSPGRPGPPPPQRQPLLHQLCQALFDGSGGTALWPANPPQESTAQQTDRRGGSVLQQVLNVFAPEEAPEAYGQLQEAATGCDRFPAVLDGTAVTVLLQQVIPAPNRQESHSVVPELTPPADHGGHGPDPDRRESTPAVEGYEWQITVVGEDGDETLTGWLAVDRVGPVVSVLRQVGPEGSTSDRDRAETRSIALGKLYALLLALER